MYRDVQE